MHAQSLINMNGLRVMCLILVLTLGAISLCSLQLEGSGN